MAKAKRPRRKPKPTKKKARKRKPKKRVKRKKKPGPPSFQSGKVLFRRAGYDAKVQFIIDKNKGKKAHQLYRDGYRYMWRTCPKVMENLEFPKPGTFSKSNGHNGEIWGWKKECSMTNKKAGRVLVACVLAKTLTLPQLKVVRKSLAYTYQLMGNEVTDKKNNWSSVYHVWRGVSEKNCVPKRSTKPKVVPNPEDLKRAFTTSWSPDSQMPFLKSVIARRAAFDIFVSGCRPNEDTKRLKNSRTHCIDVEEGWCWTDYKGGRAKLRGAKKNTRPWKQWAVCWCKGGKHKSPTLRERYNIGEDGNPLNGRPGFDDRCIIAGFEFTNLFIEDPEKFRRYPNLNRKGGNVAARNVGEPVTWALEWLQLNGANKPFGTNSGRKALAHWLSLLNVVYEEGFEIHADAYGTWESSYQQGCIRHSPDFKRRTQTDKADVATRALRRFSQWIGLGPTKPVRQMSLLERQMDMQLRLQGYGKQCDDMLLGLNPTLPDVKPLSVKRERRQSEEKEK